MKLFAKINCYKTGTGKQYCETIKTV